MMAPTARPDFALLFGHPPEAQADAPGRVNLLGEHTDYNDGFVLPVAIAQRTTVAMRRNGGGVCALHAAVLGRTVRFVLGHPPAEQAARYVYGCLMEATGHAARIPGLDILVTSEVPMGVGLSSSAALEVATLRCLRALLALPMDDVLVARLAQRAEVLHAGVRCGILDQMASSLADTRRALLLDTRSLERRFVELPPGSDILVLDSGVPRALADSGYNQRRAECEQAARLLGAGSLRELQDAPGAAARIEALPDPLRRRARHVFSENARVLQAVRCERAEAFGALMNASHASLRDDYEVSVGPLDTLVAQLQRHPQVYGARLTGAGFGGACVALVRRGSQHEVAQAVLRDYASQGGQGRQLVPAPAGAA